jgi:hypothetical protein
LWAQLGRSGQRTDLLSIWQRYELSGMWISTRPVNLALSTDGDLAVTGGSDGRVRVWKVATGACLHTFAERSTGNILTITLVHDNRLAVSADGLRWEPRRCGTSRTASAVRAVRRPRGGHVGECDAVPNLGRHPFGKRGGYREHGTGPVDGSSQRLGSSK